MASTYVWMHYVWHTGMSKITLLVKTSYA